MVHQAVHRGLGVVLAYLLDRVVEALRLAAYRKVGHQARKGVIHHRVELRPSQISAAFAVAYLVGGVLPDLAEDICVGLLRLNGEPQPVEEFIGQFVGNVEPPAGCARP